MTHNQHHKATADDVRSSGYKNLNTMDNKVLVKKQKGS